MGKGHKPKAASRSYTIRGSTGTSRKAKQWRQQQDTINERMRRPKCVTCLSFRAPRSYPICDDCIKKRLDREKRP